jgi:hypothetical protein
MVLMLKIINDLIHCIIQLMLLRRREDGDNSILFMTPRRVAVDNDSSPCRPSPVFNLEPNWHERRRIDCEVGHVRGFPVLTGMGGQGRAVKMNSGSSAGGGVGTDTSVGVF